MNDKKYYLKSNIQVEPLINNWYAWIQIVPPVQCALNILERHLPMLNSYVSAPQFHTSAVKNPAMKGGPFVDLGGEYIEEVKELIRVTEDKAEQQIQFAKAIKSLNVLLKEKAKGFKMEPLYQEVPDTLKGFVELVYDMNQNPFYRFFESLLYKSEFYNQSLQSIALSIIEKDADRPFIFSTPRLAKEDVLVLNLSFSHHGIDELFKMKTESQSLAFIKEKLNISIENEKLFESFFTTEKPVSYQKYKGEGIRFRYFGHACILIETTEVSILIDPCLSYTYESDISRYTYDDLPDVIDYVLITHSHHDHILLETMLQIRNKVSTIVVGKNINGVIQDPSLKLMLENTGFKNVIELGELESIEFENGMITGIPFMGEHHDLFIQSKLCYLINYKGNTILSAADSCNHEPILYSKVKELYGEVDVLFVGMECDGAPSTWVYGPLFSDPPSRETDYSKRGRGCNYDEANSLVEIFNPKEVYVYAMGEEPWVNHILDVYYDEKSNPILQSNMLIEECNQRGIITERLYAEKEITFNYEENITYGK